MSTLIRKRLTPILFLALVLLSALSAVGQNYNNAIGLRLGYPFGITAKFGLKGTNQLELIAAGYGNGLTLTGLWEHHWYPADRKEFSVYAGGGGHVGVFNDKRGPYFERSGSSNLNLGVDGIVGIEWTFTQAPINLSFDYKPAFSIIEPVGYWYGDAGFSVRYVW